MRHIYIGLIATTLFAAAPKVELLRSNGVSICQDREATVDCTAFHVAARTLRITVGSGNSTSAYVVNMIVPGNKVGEERMLYFLVKREERAYRNVGELRKYATFFTLPIDVDIPILKIWVNALSWDDDGFYSATIGDQ